jgi:hypothetical protein
MAGKRIYGHATYVDPTTYPDDGSSPVGTTEWNLAPDQAGMIGNTPTNATRTISANPSGTVTPTDSVTVVAANTGTSGTITRLVNTETNEYDLIYLFADTGDTITLTNTANPSTAGDVKTISGSNEVLSATVPTILIRKGTYWYGYGGGSAGTPTEITVADTTDTTCFPALFESATGDLEPKTDAGISYNAGTGILTSTGFAGPITGNVTGNASGSSGSCTGNSLTATEATNVTAVANNSTNETVYPTFVDGATGTQGIETDTGLNYNPSTGLLSAVGLTLSGDLTVNGTNTILNTSTLEVEDKTIEIAKVSSPSNSTANGAGIIIEAGSDTDKSILWDSTNSNFTSTEHVNVASGKSFKVDNTLLKDVAETLTNKSIVATQLTGIIADARMPDLTGEVTTSEGAVATVIVDDIIDEANLKVNNSPTDGYVLKALASASGGLTWGTGGGAIEDYVSFDNTSVTTYTGNSTTFVTSGVATRDIYIKKIDAYNEGVFTKIFKNGSAVEVQIA